jgi:hypothetical protein
MSQKGNAAHVTDVALIEPSLSIDPDARCSIPLEWT